MTDDEEDAWWNDYRKSMIGENGKVVTDEPVEFENTTSWSSSRLQEN